MRRIASYASHGQTNALTLQEVPVSRFELLIGAKAFWSRAAADIAAAKRRVLIQAMTFEGDTAGQSVAAEIAASRAADRRVLIDDYTRNVVNDTMLPLPFRPADVLAEAARSRAMFGDLVKTGVSVRVTDPVLGNPLRYPLRNHKKLLVMDDVAYLGGINFSDHNFSWHDLMVRIEDGDAARFLADEFGKDWAGRPSGASADFAELSLTTFDGVTNVARSAALIARIAGARRSLDVVCAYPTMPFTQAFEQAARGGARVEVFTPAASNKAIIRDYLAGAFAGTGVVMRFVAEMTHAKAILIDGDALLVGSHNFNFPSHRSNCEILAEIRDPELIADFIRRVLEPIRAAAIDAPQPAISPWRRLRAKAGLTIGDAVLARLKRGPARVIEWPTAKT